LGHCLCGVDFAVDDGSGHGLTSGQGGKSDGDGGEASAVHFQILSSDDVVVGSSGGRRQGHIDAACCVCRIDGMNCKVSIDEDK
jgi:hypothetical protein